MPDNSTPGAPAPIPEIVAAVCRDLRLADADLSVPAGPISLPEALALCAEVAKEDLHAVLSRSRRRHGASPTVTVTVSGYSDDLIDMFSEDRGFSEEFETRSGGGKLIFDSGLILRVFYDDEGIWRIQNLTPDCAAVGDEVTIKAAQPGGVGYTDAAIIWTSARVVYFEEQDGEGDDD